MQGQNRNKKTRVFGAFFYAYVFLFVMGLTHGCLVVAFIGQQALGVLLAEFDF